MMNRLAWNKLLFLALLCAGVLALLPAAAEQAPELLEPAGVTTRTTTVRRGEISRITAYDGAVAPYVEPLSLSVPGVVDEVHVIVGQQVKAGDALLTLDCEVQEERIEAIRQEIAYTTTNGAYEDELAALDLAILELELQALEQQYPLDEQAVALKKLDIEQAVLEQELALQLRALSLRQLQEEQALLEEELRKAVLYAPFDGQVIFLESLEKGSAVQAYAPLVDLADCTRLSIRAPYIASLSNSTFHALYALVGAQRYEIKPVPIETEDYISQLLAGETIMLTFEILNPDENLHAGDYAAVCAQAQYVGDALLLPRSALYADSSGQYVYRQVDGKRVRQNISVGVTTDWDVQVTQGLEEGDVVYVKE